MNRYQELGVRPVINAAATLTRLGGSRIPPSVAASMAAAAGAFIDLPELQVRVGQRIAELTHNEAAYVSSGAAAGIVHAVAACIAGVDRERIEAFPYLDGIARTEVIIARSQRNGHDYAARQTGARLVEIGSTSTDLESAIHERTACVLWFAGAHFAGGALPIADVVRIAHERGVPVIVDAAAQIPPISNLWYFTRDEGADLAIFSGGKGLRGPQSSGLVVGRADLIAACRANGNPNATIGRPMKVGKEELIGVLSAVEWSLAQDEPAVIEQYEQSVRLWIEGLSALPGVSAERRYPSEAGQPFSRAIVHFFPASGVTRDEVVEALWDGDPRIAVGIHGLEDDAIALNPQTLEAGEDQWVLDAIRGVLSQRSPSDN